ncbi:MAG TPA: GNAT family N-acetyltransferase [Iamia sp.]|nr:GNAT family N-acetyltransferase [Iamia sp.]
MDTSTDERWSASQKVELVLRSLRGEVLADLARETGLHRRQLSAWRKRFLEAGEAAVDGRYKPDAIAEVAAAREELAARVAALEAENRALSRDLARLERSRGADAVAHPYCTEAYAHALEEPGATPRFVEEWGTYVLVREAAGGVRRAAGTAPLAPLAPGCDLRAGLEALRADGIASVSLVTDPMTAPERAELEDAFDIVRPLKENYLIDREIAEPHLRKRHRNIVNGARRAVRTERVDLVDHLDEWLDMYAKNVEVRQIAQPFEPVYFERLIKVDGLECIGAFMDKELVSMSMWIRHGDVLYFHDGASTEAGFGVAASYATFAHAIDDLGDCRFAFLAGASTMKDDPLDGLAVFKRGFSNSSTVNHLCNAVLQRRAPARA